MKLRLGLIVFSLIFVLTGVANAHYFSIDPTGILETTLGTELAFDINFTNESAETIGVDVWDIKWNYDLLELDPVYVDDPFNPGYKVDFFFGSGLATSVDESAGTYATAAGNLLGYDTIAAGETATLATVYFTVVGGYAADGLSDLEWTGLTSGSWEIGIFDSGQGHSITNFFDGANGPDVSAVPVPAAAWLLGSGLLGLISLRRRNR